MRPRTKISTQICKLPGLCTALCLRTQCNLNSQAIPSSSKEAGCDNPLRAMTFSLSSPDSPCWGATALVSHLHGTSATRYPAPQHLGASMEAQVRGRDFWASPLAGLSSFFWTPQGADGSARQAARCRRVTPGPIRNFSPPQPLTHPQHFHFSS